MKWNKIISCNIAKYSLYDFLYNYFWNKHPHYNDISKDMHYSVLLLKYYKKVIAWFSIEYKYIIPENAGPKEVDEFSYYQLSVTLIKIRRRKLFNTLIDKIPIMENEKFTCDIYVTPL